MIELIKTYRSALFFLFVFIGLYLLLNTLYGFFIANYYPAADPVTINITQQVSMVLSLFYDEIGYHILPELAYVSLKYRGQEVINVFEGCNGLNVMIVYLSFLFAFSGSVKSTTYFALLGLLVLHLVNLIRVILLFEVSLLYPQQLYFFHKYFFTAILYLFVFGLWYLWVKRVKHEKFNQHAG